MKSVIKFLQKRFESKIMLLSREPFKMTLPEFRSDKSMVAMADKVIQNQNFRLMLQVLYNSSPAWEVLSDARPDQRITQQCRIEGYTMALANLESMSKYESTLRPDVAETYEPEEEQAAIQHQ